MRVLVSGNQGYIGPQLVSRLLAEGHEVVGLDSNLFAGRCLEAGPDIPTIESDIRDVSVETVRGFDAVAHLAGLSNDPLGMLDPALTHEINVEGTRRLARLAREAGVRRFINSSSCSVYGAAEEPWVDEQSPLRPVTAYGESKVDGEREVAALADDDFVVVSFRNATAFGYSPNLRADVVVNDLTAGAYLNGEIRLNSDGSAWRPLVHVQDIAQAYVRALTAPAAGLNGRAFNVGDDRQNYTILTVAQTVADGVPGARLVRAEHASADRRSYRVRFDAVRSALPGFACEVDLAAGIADLVANFQRIGLRSTASCVRLAALKEDLASGRLDERLRVASRKEAAIS